MTDEIDDVLEKLRHLVDGPETIEVLTKGEVAVLRRVIKMVDMFDSLGKFGKWLLWILSIVAGGLIAWETIAQRVAKWLAGS